MRVSSISWLGYAVPFKHPYITAHSRAVTRYGLLIFLTAEDGTVGVGEASPIGVGSHEEVERIAEDIRHLSRIILRTIPQGSDYHQLLRRIEMPNTIRFGLESAYIDLQGQLMGMSALELIGGRVTKIPINSLIASETLDEALSELSVLATKGFTSIKLKVGARGLEEEIAFVSSIREAVGPDIKIRIDVNGCWGVNQAIEALKQFEPYNLEYVEQPTSPDDQEGLAKVRRAVSIPIALDESIGSIEQGIQIITQDLADILVIKAARLGGIHNAQTIGQMADTKKISVVVTSSLESGVGILASAYLASTIPCHRFAHGLGTGLLLTDDLTSSDHLIANGILTIPSGSGLGFKLVETTLKRYGIGIAGQNDYS